jgi:hypothetical protein
LENSDNTENPVFEKEIDEALSLAMNPVETLDEVADARGELPTFNP